ncbi:CPBP family intramembrane metalloprotease [Candidatus Bathyarchaeota archaeon]|nr:CPBP family intramembrane metalloprotease [Candidatus Bathyarchaeota archaeon]
MARVLKGSDLVKTATRHLGPPVILFVVQVSLYYLFSPEETISSLGIELVDSEELLLSMIAFTPIIVLFEEVGLRAVPHYIYTGLSKGWMSVGDYIENLNDSDIEFYLLLGFGLVNGFMHLMNVESASFLNTVKYLFIHFVGGAYLGGVYLKYGFKQVYLTHLLYNMMVFIAFYPE